MLVTENNRVLAAGVGRLRLRPLRLLIDRTRFRQILNGVRSALRESAAPRAHRSALARAERDCSVSS